MRLGLRVLVIVLVLVLGPGLGSVTLADTVTLKDGQVLEGTIVEETATQVVIQVPGAGALKFAKDRVLSVDRDAPKKPGEDGGAGGEVPTLPEPTPEEAVQIEQLVFGLGDTRQAGGAGTRRENAVTALVDLGIVAIPALTEALKDRAGLGHAYRRRNAARALTGIARKDPRLPLYREAIPWLIANLNDVSDPHPRARKLANDALEAISGRSFGYPPIPDDLPAPAAGEAGTPPAPEEIEAARRWQAWWDEERVKLPPAAPPG